MNPTEQSTPAAQEPHTVEPSTKWLIWVSGCGQFDFDGTETEAEEMRRHKATWERGQGRKWRADLSRESDRLTAEIVDLWSSHQGVPQSLMSRLKKAVDAETAGADQ